MTKSIRDRIQWVLLVILGVTAIVLGHMGFTRYFRFHNPLPSVLDRFYLTLQLFTLESGSIAGVKSWELEIARLLAPAVAAFAAVKALMLLFRDQFMALRLRMARGHIIVCGLGRRGIRIAEGLKSAGYSVAVIEIDEGNDSLESCRGSGIPAVIGDASDAALLKKAGILRASRLICVCGSDGTNAEIALKALKESEHRKRRTLNILVHINDPGLCGLFRDWSLRRGLNASPRLEFFNIYERGAQAWVRTFPLSGFNGDVQSPRLLFIGMGVFGEKLLEQVLRSWAEDHRNKGTQLPVLFIDKDADRIHVRLERRFPALCTWCDLQSMAMDITEPEFLKGVFLEKKDRRPLYSAVYICLDDDSLGLSAALSLRRHSAARDIPIMIRMGDEGGLSLLLHESEEGFFPFSLLDRTCDPEILLGGLKEYLARMMHEEYRLSQIQKGETVRNNPSLVSWSELDEALKESNRCQADHIGLKLDAVGCGLEPLVEWDEEPLTFTNDEVELLAKMEHERWMEERKNVGWKRTRGRKNIRKKTSPDLVPWEELNEKAKEKDRNTVRRLPQFLARAGYRLKRKKSAAVQRAG